MSSYGTHAFLVTGSASKTDEAVKKNEVDNTILTVFQESFLNLVLQEALDQGNL